ncbi:hypothetical protein D9619_007924 [Psilocybe cf. subviscida]|uniref:HMG box domain-containing protein n=1 Tax=Psilocybe cf. subviscida TaxID=2480587 RepID=A0A8H5AUC6_9AGAR|nr:hypothetical protein D9619_007924 [Psilocybe cf. subviscida]
MPAFRNIGAPQRMSARLEKRTPVVYDNEGWPITDGLDTPTRCTYEQESLDIAKRDATTPVPRSPSPVPATINPSSLRIDADNEADVPTATATVPRRNSHSRRRDPGHVPRPRNAFIIFRSHYISTAQASGEGQQNELSKLAGKAWTKMSEEKKRPFAEQAAAEKMQHARDYPNYVYCPGRASAGKSSKAKAKAAAARRSSASSASSSSSANKKRASQRSRSPEWDSDEPESPALAHLPPPPRSNRTPRAAAQRAAQLMEHHPSMSPSASPECLRTDASESKSLFDELNPISEGFVPTEDIPVLELTPSPYMAPKSPQMPTLHVPCIPSHQETSQLVPGFKPYLPSDALNTTLPILPEFRHSAPYDHTLNGLHFDYSASNLYDTTVQPLPRSSDIDITIKCEPEDPSAACGGSNNCNDFDYYECSPTDFDSPMDDLPDDDFYKMYIRSPSPVEALF